MNKPLVLVVEDSEMLRLLAVTQLSRLGLRAETASGGQEAIEKWTSGRFDVILMDVMMPGITGLEATRAIRAREQETGAPRTPIIALTAFGERKECLESGMDDYLFKPVKLEDLRAALANWLPAAQLTELTGKLLDRADHGLSQTRSKLDSVGDRLGELKRKYGLSE